MKQFLRMVAGNVGVTTGFMLLPLVGAVGVAVDFTNKTWEQDSIQRAADAAILAGVNETQVQIEKGKPRRRAIRLGKRTARAIFKANLEQSGLTSKGRFRPRVQANAGGIAGSGTYKGQMPTSFARILGFESLSIAVVSRAEISQARYIDVHYVVDVSASMGVGATYADIKVIWDNFSCQFACHQPSGMDFLDLQVADARGAGARLRIDVVKDALQSALNTLKQGNSRSGLRVAIHTFSNNLNTVQGLTANLNGANAKVDTLELTNAFGEGGTMPRRSFEQLAAILERSGDGRSAANPKKIVVILTDGAATNRYFTRQLEMVEDTRGYQPFGEHRLNTGSGWVQSLNPEACEPLKRDVGATVFVLNVRYLTPGVDLATPQGARFFRNIRLGILPLAETSMEECATTKQHAYAAETPEEIEQALLDMLHQYRKTALRLTK